MCGQKIRQITFNPVSGWLTVDYEPNKINERNHHIPEWLKEKGCDVLLYGWVGFAYCRINEVWYDVDLRNKQLNGEIEDPKEAFKYIAISYAMSEEEYDPDTPSRVVGL